MKIFTMSKQLILTLSFLSLAVFLSNCGEKKSFAVGAEDQIVVVADSSEYLQLKSNLEQIFGQVIYTPQPENLFVLTRKSVNDLNTVKLRKNIIIIAPLNSGSYTSQYMNSILDSAVVDLVKRDSVKMITRRGLWAEDQLVMLLTAKDMESLNSYLMEDRDNLLYQFRKASDARLSKGVYSDEFEKKDVQGKLLQDYGWMIYVQADYKLAKNVPEDNFVWLRRGYDTDMEKWIFVHWLDDVTPEYLDIDSVTALRNKMTEKYYLTRDELSSVEMVDQYRTTREVNFNGRYAIVTEGLWQMKDKSMGGPFINYTFYDESTKRLYMLDGSIYAPKYYKKNLIQQLDITLRSFKTAAEVTPERKMELAAAVKK